MKYLFFQIFLYCIFVGFLKAALQCPSEGKWIMKSFDNSFFCYTIIELESNAKELQSDDICKRNAHPSSKIASIHSQAENDFLMQNFYGAMIGFWIPKKLKWNPANFQWSDGSTVDFIGWDIKGIPKQPDNQIPAERFVKLRKKFKSSGWHDYQFKEMKKVLCKMNAFENTNIKTTLLPTKTSSENTTPLSTTKKADTSTTKTTNKELEVTFTSGKTSDTISTGTSTTESTTTPSATTSTVSESIQSTTTETTTVSSITEIEVIATTTFIDKDIVILDGAKP